MTSPNELEGAVELDEAHRALTAASRRLPELWEQPHKAAEGVVVMPQHLRLILAALKAARHDYHTKAREAETALASITRERDEARGAWTWLAKNTNIELDHRYEDEDDDGGTWRVHRVNGGVNDREWTLVARGRTPLEAVQRARAAALVNGEGGK